jgi:hypothetical protein
MIIGKARAEFARANHIVLVKDASFQPSLSGSETCPGNRRNAHNLATDADPAPSISVPFG